MTQLNSVTIYCCLSRCLSCNTRSPTNDTTQQIVDGIRIIAIESQVNLTNLGLSTAAKLVLLLLHVPLIVFPLRPRRLLVSSLGPRPRCIFWFLRYSWPGSSLTTGLLSGGTGTGICLCQIDSSLGILLLLLLLVLPAVFHIVHLIIILILDWLVCLFLFVFVFFFHF